ncbi:hypothetical protein CHP16_001460 [Salmonella enterica subsp. enterica serovar Sandiego]|nr:hypothetical protein [Salmonella enterica subsp. enterica serovar Sandiego]
MIWILLSLSTGYYNSGNISGVEFNSHGACIEAREEVRKHDRMNVVVMCVKKGEEAQ